MSAPLLQCKLFYGLKTDIAGNAYYLSDSEILYPIGSALSIHNIFQRRQRLIRLPDKQKINIMTVSSNKKYAAVSEIGEKPTITVYDLQSLKRKKSLFIPYEAPGITRFSAISFTIDNKYIAAITGEPDQMMLYYNWEKGKVESNIKIGNSQNQNSIINLLACNPGDTGIVAIAGPFIFKFLTVSETVWRPYGFSKADNLIITSIAWLSLDRLFAGTKNGKLLFLENGELKNIYNMIDTRVMNLKIREDYIIQSAVSQESLEIDKVKCDLEILCLTIFGNCFAFALGPGRIIVFEQNGQNNYVKRHLFIITNQTSGNDSEDLYRVNTINANSSNDRLIITAGLSQLFYVTIRTASGDFNAEIQAQEVRILGENLHHGPIGSISMCTWKPIFITCGQLDRTVRIWNYESESLIMIKQYSEDILCVALHPNGLFCLVGFIDKLRFMTILIDNLIIMHEFPIRNCKRVAFSNGGHLIAAINGNIIHVYSTINFKSRFLLKGHTGRIKGFVWSKNDEKLVTIGLEGAIYEWDMRNGERVMEVILKEVVLNGVVLSQDDTTIYCISNDYQIRVIKDEMISRTFNLKDLEINLLVMGKENALLFATCSDGVVLSLKCPLQEPLEYLDFHLHNTKITEMAISIDERTLITTGLDGSLCFWKILYQRNRMEKDFYTSEILIGRSELEEKLQSISNLTTRMRELESEHIYKIRQAEIKHNDTVREIHQGYCEAIEELKANIEKLQEVHIHELNNINTEIVKMKAAHDDTVQRMEVDYEMKLIAEYEKYSELEKNTIDMRREYEKKIEKLKRDKDESIEELSAKYEAHIFQINKSLIELKEDMEYREKVNEEMRQEIEDDADREIMEIRNNYENIIDNEKQTNLKLRGEIGVLRNKNAIVQKEISDLEREISVLKDDQLSFEKRMQELNNDIIKLKQEIIERDAKIRDNGRIIEGLERDNQELKKYKFVLEHEVKQFKSQMEPNYREIRDLKEKITDIERELNNLHKVNNYLELQYRESKEKLETIQRKLNSEREKSKKCQMLLRKMQIDIFNTSRLIQEPQALKGAVMNLYHQYCNDEEFLRIQRENLDIQCEFVKQRGHLERTIAILRKQVFHDGSGGSREMEKLMDENVMLIVELNSLRDGLKQARKHINDMEYILGISSGDVDALEARNKLAKACHGNEEIQIKYKTEIQECQKIITVLKDDIKRLISKLITST